MRLVQSKCGARFKSMVRKVDKFSTWKRRKRKTKPDGDQCKSIA
jgi:hypothetical protein